MATAWRLVKAAYATDAFTGEGARLYGGRWNPPGVRVIYAAETAALAAWEVWIKWNEAQLPTNLLLFRLTIPERLVTVLDPPTLPPQWDTYPCPLACQAIGATWVAHRTSAVLRVPSVVIRQETNYLLNPEHTDFRAIEIADPVRFEFDWRALRSVSSR